MLPIYFQKILTSSKKFETKFYLTVRSLNSTVKFKFSDKATKIWRNFLKELTIREKKAFIDKINKTQTTNYFNRKSNMESLLQTTNFGALLRIY